MKIREYITLLEAPWDGQDSSRECLRALIEVLSPVSKGDLHQAQPRMLDESAGDFRRFVELQSDRILTCLRLEMADVGTQVRKQFGLEPLTLDTEI